MRQTLFLPIVFFLLSFSFHCAANKPRVVFINPGVSSENHETGGFWFNVSAFMQAAADDLAFDLEILYAERNHRALSRLTRSVVTREKKPDYLIIVNEMEQGAEQLSLAVKAKVKTFMILNTLSLAERQTLSPINPFKEYWIGSLVPDNFYAGKAIGQHLIAGVHKQGLDHKKGVQIVAIAGDHVTPASIQRTNGLREALVSQTDSNLLQIFTAYWSKEEARFITAKALARFPDMNAIWAANDPIALGAVEAMLEQGIVPGKQVLVGGLNWDRPALEAIKKGHMQFSMGGHFMTGGWALVLLHDYHRGHPFLLQNSHREMRIFSKIDLDNIAAFERKFASQNWQKIDFARFSMISGSSHGTYNFSLEALLEQP